MILTELYKDSPFIKNIDNRLNTPKARLHIDGLTGSLPAVAIAALALQRPTVSQLVIAPSKEEAYYLQNDIEALLQGESLKVNPEGELNTLENKDNQVKKGERWLVTAGPTYERIDSVRFIGNYSSGKMGFALAQALADAGAEVELVSGPTFLSINHPRIHRTSIESAREMYAAATEVFPRCNGAILSAAVADYRPSECADHKLKKNGSEGMHLDLVQNPDILATLGSMKTDKQTLVGFALETDNEEANALRKLEKKNLDYIVLNSLRDKGAGFGVDTNKVTIIGRNGSRKESPLLSKQEVAKLIVEEVAL